MDKDLDILLKEALAAFVSADYYPFPGVEGEISAALRSRSRKKKASVLARLPAMLAQSDRQSVRGLGKAIAKKIGSGGMPPGKPAMPGNAPMKKHSIGNAHGAWWFLYYHPRLCLRARVPEPEEKHAKELKTRGFIVTRDKNGQHWREWRHLLHHAMEENFSIFYTMVGKDREPSNSPDARQECWLETGPMEWGYMTPWDKETGRINYHDPDLDCGGSTFDEALVNLAGIVLKEYGDYKEREGREGACGRPRCIDCVDTRRSVRKMMRSIRAEKTKVRTKHGVHVL